MDRSKSGLFKADANYMHMTFLRGYYDKNRQDIRWKEGYDPLRDPERYYPVFLYATTSLAMIQLYVYAFEVLIMQKVSLFDVHISAFYRWYIIIHKLFITIFGYGHVQCMSNLSIPLHWFLCYIYIRSVHMAVLV